MYLDRDTIAQLFPHAEYNSTERFLEQLLPMHQFYNSKLFSIRYWGYKSIFYFFMYFDTFVIKLRFIHSAELTMAIKELCRLCLFIFAIWLLKGKSKCISMQLMYGLSHNYLTVFPII